MIKTSILTAVSALALCGAASADISISSKPTSNMSCDAGVCTATAQKAVLNVTDLATMLASGDVAVKTGLTAKNIDIDQPLTWSSTSRLTLDAQASVTVKKQITVAGQGALTVVTNDTGGARGKNKAGEFIIVPEHGSVQFWDLSSSLIIDSNSYTLVGDIKTLAADIAANPSGFYALAKPYDAGVDGAYSGAAIGTTFGGVLDGLGNVISNLTISTNSLQLPIGLFAKIDGATVRAMGFEAFKFTNNGRGVESGILVGQAARAHVENCFAAGSAYGLGEVVLGGLVGQLYLGSISNSDVDVDFVIENPFYGATGGLVGDAGGTVTNSYATGRIKSLGHGQSNARIGGLAGANEGQIKDSFALVTIHAGKKCCTEEDAFAGLVGINWYGGTIGRAYAAGRISIGGQAYIGGLVGNDMMAPGSISDAYWDLDSSGIEDPSHGAGTPANDPGITGLTDAQLKSGLPAGFDPKIWGQSPNINHGYPYLLANPPR